MMRRENLSLIKNNKVMVKHIYGRRICRSRQIRLPRHFVPRNDMLKMNEITTLGIGLRSGVTWY